MKRMPYNRCLYQLRLLLHKKVLVYKIIQLLLIQEKSQNSPMMILENPINKVRFFLLNFVASIVLTYALQPLFISIETKALPPQKNSCISSKWF